MNKHLRHTKDFIAKHFLLIMVVVSIVSVIALVFKTIGFLLDDLCGNQIKAEIRSPDGRLKAVVFNRDCGATTGFSTQISILNYGDKLPNIPGNVFTMDADHNPDVSLDVDVTWKDNRKIEVAYDPRARVFANVRTIDVWRLVFPETVQVDYRERIPKSK